MRFWTKLWYDRKNINNKLAFLKPTSDPWPSTNRSSRRQEILLTRLHIRHNRITHCHLLKPHKLEPPSCLHRFHAISVVSIFTCPQLSSLRNYNHIPHSHIQALHTLVPNLNNIFKFPQDAALIFHSYKLFFFDIFHVFREPSKNFYTGVNLRFTNASPPS